MLPNIFCPIHIHRELGIAQSKIRPDDLDHKSAGFVPKHRGTLRSGNSSLTFKTSVREFIQVIFISICLLAKFKLKAKIDNVLTSEEFVFTVLAR